MDERLRALDRQRRGSGAITDEAAWLQERLRRGDLSRERLYIAAALGHPPALAALALRPRPATWVSWAWLRLAGPRPRLEPGAGVRVALALTLPGEDEAGPALGALLRWCACPCAAHADEVKTAEESLISYGAAHEDGCERLIVRAACSFVSDTSGGEIDWLHGIDLLRRGPLAPRAALEARAAVVPWALGLGDPITLRAEAAQEALSRLRARWEETRARSDEVAWLRGRLRAGLISADRLRLAAHLGDAASATVLGDASAIDDAAAWADRTSVWGLDACIRFALAVARSTVPATSASQRALDAAEEWLRCPCEPHRTEVRNLALGQDSGVVRAALGWAEVTRERLIAAQERAAAKARELALQR